MCVSFSHESQEQPASQRCVFDPERCNKADKQQRVNVKLASFNYQFSINELDSPLSEGARRSQSQFVCDEMSLSSERRRPITLVKIKFSLLSGGNNNNNNAPAIKDY